MQEGRLMRSPSKSQNPPCDLNLAEGSPTKAKIPVRRHDTEPAGLQPRSILAAIRRTHSSASALPKDIPPERRLFQKVPTTRTLQSNGADLKQAEGETIQPLPVASSSTSRQTSPPSGADPSGNQQDSKASNGLFCGLSFRILGEAKCAHVKTALEEAGGCVIGDLSDETADFTIVRLVRYC